MRFNKSLKIALNIIFHSKVRTWLTIIGIVIGIAAIVSIVSLGQGAQQSLTQNLNSLSADIITINSGFSRAFGAGAGFRTGGMDGGLEGGSGATTGLTPKNLTERDVIALRGVSNVQSVMGIISGSVDTVTYLGKSARGSIEGVDEGLWKSMDSTALASGRYLVQGDTDAVVVGGRVATSTFTNIQINQPITINGKIFRVVGILAVAGGTDDSRIFMPLESALPLLDGKTKNNFDSITVKVTDISQVDDTVTQITSTLMASHGILQSKNQDFSVTSMKAVQERVSSILGSMSIFLTAIAAISLIVGAIGIMNSMFTSVLEKTRDIGVLKALGAKNSDILGIFLINSGIIGLVGGIFGIILGVIASSYISILAGASSGSGGISFSAYVSPFLVIGVFIISLVVGLIAGAIPAYRASRLNPVEALRYE